MGISAKKYTKTHQKYLLNEEILPNSYQIARCLFQKRNIKYCSSCRNNFLKSFFNLIERAFPAYKL